MTVRTVTLSPGFDHVVVTDSPEELDTGRVVSWRILAAGKGLNVARFLHYLECPAVAYSLVGEDDTGRFRKLAAESGVVTVLESVPGGIRNNLTISTSSQKPAVHMVGPRLAVGDSRPAERLVEKLLRDVEPGDLVTFNGAVPDGVRSDIWAQAAAALRDSGAAILADVQGVPLMQLLTMPGLIMVKPNEDEVLTLPSVRPSMTPLERGIAGVLALEDLGVQRPMVTLGGQGLVALDRGNPVRISCIVERPRVFVGAGDALLAGYCLAAVRDGLEECRIDGLRFGVATAAAHVSGAELVNLALAARKRLQDVTVEPMTSSPSWSSDF
ncbi:MAG: hypothetical protein K1X67_07255 [Fimbriimonadaceae bacterium]|nr:hypothetical protein [Fimbriimonadaceae bacterium]